jgi:sulfur carrier protein ThiS adenylyltransferase
VTSSTSFDVRDRDIRQRELVPPERLATCRALVVGVGAIGRQIAVQLAALGVPVMDLIDHDIVAVENLGPQAYYPHDVGVAKVEATASVCQLINPELQLQLHQCPFRRSSAKTLTVFSDHERERVLFCCVDSIGTRRLIWEAVKEKVAFFTDGRMSAEVIRVLTASQPASDQNYEQTLFEPQEAYAGSCTAKSTIYTASIAAGLMVGQFTKWLRHLPLERDFTLNLLSAELVVP